LDFNESVGLDNFKTKKVTISDDFSLLVAGTEYPDVHFVRSGWTSGGVGGRWNLFLYYVKGLIPFFTKAE
jgi:hypothetical protein